MKKTLTCLLALILLLSFAAFAETDDEDADVIDSYVGYLTLYDTVLSIDDAEIDLSGLLAAINLGITDTQTTEIALQLYNASSYKLLFYAAAQLDENGLTLFADGLSDMYTLSTDALIELGFDPSDIASAALYTTLSSSEPFTDADRLDALESFFASCAADPEETDDGTIYEVTISASDFSALLESFGSSLGNIVDPGDIALSLSGTVTRDDTVLTANLSGALIDNSGSTAYPVEIELIDASTAVELDIILTDGDTDITLIYTESPSYETDEIEYVLALSSGGDEIVNLTVQYDFLDAADTSIAADLAIAGETVFTLNYAGVADSSGDEHWQTGAISFSIYGDSEINLYTDVIIGYLPSSSSQWAQDTSENIDLSSMDDAQTEALNNALDALVEDLIDDITDISPDLEPYLTALFG